MARKRKLCASEETNIEPRKAKRRRAPPKLTRESLTLGRHILNLYGVKYSDSFGNIKHPEKMTSFAGIKVREFVQHLCSREPMATFARMSLAPRGFHPSAPSQEDLKVLSQLTDDHFWDLWRRIDRLFPRSGDFKARSSLETKFIRGALSIVDTLPVGWDRGVDVLSPARNRMLDCDQLVTYADSDKTTGNAHYLSVIGAPRLGMDSWQHQADKGATKRLCKIIERDVSKFRESQEGKEATANFILSRWDIFNYLIQRNPMFASAVCSLAPLDDYKKAIEEQKPGFPIYTKSIYLAIEKAAAERRDECFKSLCESDILIPPLARIIAGYYI